MATALRIEGGLFSPDLLDRLDDAPGQRPADFGLEGDAPVRDEIARAWADILPQWRAFRHRLAALPADSPATRETRQLWVLPLLQRLGWRLEGQPRGLELDGQPYPLSHAAVNLARLPVHVTGWRDAAGLDRRPEGRPGALRLSAHALVQAVLNRSELLYGVASNGRVLRLLRASHRFVKPAYLEFDLERLFGDGLFADFALLFRLLHASRLPARREEAAACWLERWHQDALDAGSRIRAGLSCAVERSLKGLADGFLRHPANVALRERLQGRMLDAGAFHQQLLRLVYRLLFLMVIEERGLVFPPGAPARQRQIYERHYSLQRLRRLSERHHLADPRHADLWPALLSTFALFEAGGPGAQLGLAPLAGELFGRDALIDLVHCALGNDVLLPALRALDSYAPPRGGPPVRVNYGALNVEEFGSIYEGLLEYEPVLLWQGTQPAFDFRRGEQRAHTGAHYTPDALVQPLLKHSLDPLIAERLRAPDRAAREAALLDLRVADVACGSGHILLAAARRIATELAVVRTGEDPPAPAALRTALRDVIRQCIHGVDINPLAVELCKVALWLEAHVPGEPLGFLDHHVKCGNAIVGCVRREDVAARGIPDAAFALQPGDDKAVVAALRRRNREVRKGQQALQFHPDTAAGLDAALQGWRRLEAMPDHTPQQVEAKRATFIGLTQSPALRLMRQLADVPAAQFYVPKRADTAERVVTEAEFRPWVRGESPPKGPALDEAQAVAAQERFFHWFIEFPEVMARGGFDCVLGNPPYLGGQSISGSYGSKFCQYVRWEYAPAGLSDLVVYFVRRIFSLLRPNGYMAFITTNSIKDGDVRKDGLEQLIRQGGQIKFAMQGVRWPGRANVAVSALAISPVRTATGNMLDGKAVSEINAFLEEDVKSGVSVPLKANGNRLFQGCIFLGNGFVLAEDEAEAMSNAENRNREVIFPLLNGEEINTEPIQQPVRKIINFFDWPKAVAASYAQPFARLNELVLPVRMQSNRLAYRNRWWLYAEARPGLMKAVRGLKKCFVVAANTKHLNYSSIDADVVFAHTLFVFATDRWDLYAVVQSILHEIWARKYSGTLKQDLRYSPSRCFETFAFPGESWEKANPSLAAIGEQYHEHRRGLMRDLWLGLTGIYNLFHARDLSPALVARVSRKPIDIAQAGYEGLLELRRLHVALDTAVRDAYGWHDLDRAHGFVEVETLPERDRVRFTLHPDARRELLGRLLALNQERALCEKRQAADRPSARKATGWRRVATDRDTAALFGDG